MNCVQLIGRLTADPMLIYSQSQTAICRFTLAIDRMKKEDGADFIRCVAFGKTAENVDRYLAKGRQAAVSGRIQTGSYTDKEGRKVYTTDVIAERVEFIGGRSDGDGARDGGHQEETMPQGMPVSFAEVDENIPF